MQGNDSTEDSSSFKNLFAKYSTPFKVGTVDGSSNVRKSFEDVSDDTGSHNASEGEVSHIDVHEAIDKSDVDGNNVTPTEDSQPVALSVDDQDKLPPMTENKECSEETEKAFEDTKESFKSADEGAVDGDAIALSEDESAEKAFEDTKESFKSAEGEPESTAPIAECDKSEETEKAFEDTKESFTSTKKAYEENGKHITSFEELMNEQRGIKKSSRPDAISTSNGDITRPELGRIKKSEVAAVRMGYGVDPHSVVQSDLEEYRRWKQQYQ